MSVELWAGVGEEKEKEGECEWRGSVNGVSGFEASSPSVEAFSSSRGFLTDC